MKIRPKKWAEFQHYRDRTPPWIKLHHKLLDDFVFQSLPDASRALAPMLWLIASEDQGGVIDASPENLAFRLRTSVTWIEDALGYLIGKEFFEVVDFDSTPLAPCKLVAIPERETEREAEDKPPIVRLAPDGARKLKQLRKAEALTLLEFLNGKARRHFRPVAANISLIESRLAEGVSLQDLKTLTARKCNEWLGTDMEKYLRPETLYNARKCHSYLGVITPEDPGGELCNAPDVTGRSKAIASPAIADGALPIGELLQ